MGGYPLVGGMALAKGALLYTSIEPISIGSEVAFSVEDVVGRVRFLSIESILLALIINSLKVSPPFFLQTIVVS